MIVCIFCAVGFGAEVIFLIHLKEQEHMRFANLQQVRRDTKGIGVGKGEIGVLGRCKLQQKM